MAGQPPAVIVSPRSRLQCPAPKGGGHSSWSGYPSISSAPLLPVFPLLSRHHKPISRVPSLIFRHRSHSGTSCCLPDDSLPPRAHGLLAQCCPPGPCCRQCRGGPPPNAHPVVISTPTASEIVAQPKVPAASVAPAPGWGRRHQPPCLEGTAGMKLTPCPSTEIFTPACGTWCWTSGP